MAEYIVRWRRDGRESVVAFQLDKPPVVGENFWIAARRYIVERVDMESSPRVITVDYPPLKPVKFKELYD